MPVVINKRELNPRLNSLTAGVVPRVGLRHIAVGRQNEISAFLKDLSSIESGGSSFRLIVGAYGSGKSFLLQTIRNNALERNFITADADLSPERRLTGTKGQGLATYREPMQQLSTQVRPEGGAIESILQKWIANSFSSTAKELKSNPNDPKILDYIDLQIQELATVLAEFNYGFSFATIIMSYWNAYKNKDDLLKQNSLRWIKGEYSTKTEARRDLNVDGIIDDQNWYEFLKLFAIFIEKIGYKGLLLFIDEGVNLYKITHKQARDSNYEKLLTIFNDLMQGKAQHIGLFLSGTPQFVFDERRGLYNYDALRSRLVENRFSQNGLIDYPSPLVKLQQLSPEELYLLLERLCELHNAHYNYIGELSSDQLLKFLNNTLSRLGAEQLLTPREITRDFIGLLNILQTNAEVTFEQILSNEKYSVKPSNHNPEELLPDEKYDIFEEFDI